MATFSINFRRQGGSSGRLRRGMVGGEELDKYSGVVIFARKLRRSAASF